jgi:hypothetical protein
MVAPRRIVAVLPFLLLAACGEASDRVPGSAGSAGAAMAAAAFLLPGSFTPRAGEAVSFTPRSAESLPGLPLSWTDLDPERFVARSGGEQWVLDPTGDVPFAAAGGALVGLSAKASAGLAPAWLHLKTVIAVRGADGALPPPAAAVTARFGFTLEITPLMDPSALEPGGDLPLRVQFDGPGLAGAEVLAGHDSEPVRPRAVTGEAGEAVLRIDRAGRWLVCVRHAAGGQAHLASLLFEVGQEARR